MVYNETKDITLKYVGDEVDHNTDTYEDSTRYDVGRKQGNWDAIKQNQRYNNKV